MNKHLNQHTSHRQAMTPSALSLRPWLILALLLLWLGSPSAFSAVKSTTGVIHFDVNNDKNYEGQLDNTGLSIGPRVGSANLSVSGNAVITESITIGGGTSPVPSTLHVTGSIGMSSLVATAGTNVLGQHSSVLADSSQGNVFLTLPDANTYSGIMLNIKHVNPSHHLYITGMGNVIDQFTTLDFGPGEWNSINLMSSGSQWYILGAQTISPLAGIASSNLNLYWALDETSGNTASDSSNHQRSGNLSNQHQFSGNSSTGVLGKALSLDDSADTVSYEGGGLDTPAYSYSLWFNSNRNTSDTLNTQPTLSGKAGFIWASGNSDLHMAAYHQLDASGNYATTKITSQATLSANTWHHIAVTWDSSNLTLYLNGAQESSAPAATWVSASNMILSNPGSINNEATKLDEVYRFDKALTSDEVKALYLAAKP